MKAETREVVLVPHNELDPEIVTVQNKAHSVQELYQDFVLGRLDQSQIGAAPAYDPDDSETVDPFNHFGVTLEEASEIESAGRAAKSAIKDAQKTVANAPADKQQSKNGKVEPTGGANDSV